MQQWRRGWLGIRDIGCATVEGVGTGECTGILSPAPAERNPPPSIGGGSFAVVGQSSRVKKPSRKRFVSSILVSVGSIMLRNRIHVSSVIAWR